jgi:uncharacterized protein (TIGR00251 family)
MLQIKVVPNASRDRVAGRLGNALKVQISAAPERGKANAAVIELIADILGLRSNQIQILKGHTLPRKTLQISGIEQSELDRRISELL